MSFAHPVGSSGRSRAQGPRSARGDFGPGEIFGLLVQAAYCQSAPMSQSIAVDTGGSRARMCVTYPLAGGAIPEPHLPRGLETADMR